MSDKVITGYLNPDGTGEGNWAAAGVTPRPWLLDIIEGGGWAVVVESTSTGAKVVAELDDTTGNRAANAALIVYAVNHIEAAEAALAEAILHIDALWKVARSGSAAAKAVDEARAFLAVHGAGEGQ